MELSVIVPCYKSGPALQKLVDDFVTLGRENFAKFEIILVLDSYDKLTLGITKTLTETFTEVSRIRLSKNFGQQAATAAGIVESSGEIIVTIDDDYQHRPSDAIKLVERLRAEPEVDLVYGVPRVQKQSWGRRFTSKAFRRTMTLSGLKHFDLFSPLRAFRGEFRGAISRAISPNLALDVALDWVVAEVRGQICEFNNREAGDSGYTSLARLRLAVGFLTAHSIMPLQIGIYIGLVGAMICGSLGIYILTTYLMGTVTVPGFATTSLAILFIGSIQLVLLGVVGRYLGKQYQSSLGKPLYFIRPE